MAKDLHAILGVDEKAGPEEIRRAYLRLAVRHHPDRNPGDPEAEERFKELSQAYALLSDPAARARYERGRSKSGPQGRREGKAEKKPPPRQEPPRREPPRARPRPEAARPDTGAAPGPEPGEPEFEEILANFFRTPKGRETLRDLEGELGRAGLKFSPGDFARWFKANKKTPAAAEPKSPAGPFRGRLAAWLPGGAAWARRQAARYEINYQLTLTPEAAAAGTTVDLTYQRDGAPQQLKVKIPAGVKDGARLRLAAQGRLRPDRGRGDLVLTVLVGRRASVDDLWKM